MTTPETRNPTTTTPLERAILEYFTRIDAGETVARDEFIATHPDLSDGLKSFFEGADIVQRMARGQEVQNDTSVSANQATAIVSPTAPSLPAGAASRTPDAGTFAGPFPVTFGQYRILRRLGAGAMGEVYLAEDAKLNRKVALKVPLQSIVARADHLARFTREAQACAGLRHHNICPVYEVNELNGIHYIAMAFIEGKPLSDLIVGNRRHSPKHIAVTVRKIAQALDVAHRAGIIHRDLKPANIMIDTDGEPIVMDFGLARHLHAEDQVQLTQDGMILGTPSYMAPEQIRSENDKIGPASDVYSLGVILYELLTGQRPFSGPMMSLLMDVSAEHKQAPKPSEVSGGCDARLEAICLKMLSKRVADRYVSMKEVSGALGEFLKAGTTSPQSVPNTVNFKPAVAPRPAPGTSGAQATHRPVSEQPVSKATPKQTSGIKPPAPRVKLILGGLAALVVLGVIIITITNKDGTQTKIEVADTSKVSISTDQASGGRQPPDSSSTGKSKQESGGSHPPLAGAGWHGWPTDAPKPAIAPFDATQARQHQEAWAKYLKVPVEYSNSIGMKFRLIPPGEFTMGSTPAEIEAALKDVGEIKHWQDSIKSEAHHHKVILTLPIYLSVNEVTQSEYEKVVGTNPAHFAPMGMGKDAVVGIDTTSHPVEMVSWNDAAEFCAKLNKQEKFQPLSLRAGETMTPLDGTGYRLPSEAEWEFACRAGTTSKYWIGDRNEDLLRVGWFGGNSGWRTHAVGELKANPFGLADICGNVYEWVLDGWDATYYGRFQYKPAINPISLLSVDSLPVLRGGGLGHPASFCRSSTRNSTAATNRHNDLGFRVSLTVDAVRAGITGQTTKSVAKTGWHGWPAEAPPPAIASFDAEQARQHQEAWAKYLKVPVEYTNSIGMKFRLVPPGEFLMGSTAPEIEAVLTTVGHVEYWQKYMLSEGPEHMVILTQPIYVGVHEVTQAEYEQVIGQNPSQFSATGANKAAVAGMDTGKHPVDAVDWNDAAEFCTKLSHQEKLKPFYFRAAETVKPLDGTGYRLLTEAEWEFACVAGTATKYGVGDSDADLLRGAWIEANSGRRTHAVGELQANPFGLADMHGNLLEWVQDGWNLTFYGNSSENPRINPSSPFAGATERSLRGGDWHSEPSGCRSSSRHSSHPQIRANYTGFRVSLTVDAVRQSLNVPTQPGVE